MKKILLFIALTSNIIAVAQKGTIRGTVIEDASGLTIIGANVVIADPLTGTSTDLDGKFSLDIAPGVYDVKVSYISFEETTIKEVKVTAGEVALIGNIRLRESALALGEVVISATASRKSEAAINTMKKKSATMMDGISSQKMALTGDGTAVEAAQRVTGVSIEGGKYIYVRGLGDRYSKVTLNGVDIPGLDPDKNSLQMDIFPTSLIDNIIVSKNFTAELPADFTGGLVNIETKAFPDEKIFNASIGVSYNPSMHFNSDYLDYEGGKTDWLGFDDGTRALPDRARSQNLPNPYDEPDAEVNEFIRSFDPQFGAVKETSLMDYNASFTIGDQLTLNKKKEDAKKNPKLGYIFSLSYKSEQRHYDNVKYAEYQKSADNAEYELIYANRSNGVLSSQNNLVGVLGGLAYKSKITKIRLMMMHLQNGESRSGQFYLDDNPSAVGRSGYKGFSNNLEYSQRGLTNLLVNGTHAFYEEGWEIDWRISPTISNANDPDVRQAAFTYAVDTSFQTGNAGNPTRIWRELSENSIVGKVDLTKKHEFLGEDATLKFGVNVNYKTRDYSILGYNVQFASSQNWPGNDPNDIMNPIYVYPNRPNSSYIVSSNNDPNPNEYQANSRNFAAYISEEFEITSSLKSIIGVRMESFEMRHTGRDIAGAQGNGGNVLDNDVVLDGVDFFPSLNFIYNLAEEQNLRFGYARTIARPSFKEMSYAQILDPITGRIFNGSLFEYPGDWDGNLVETNIDNIDVRWEKFMEGGQIFSVSGFYKQFKNPIELVRIPLNYTSPEYQPRNVGNGSLFGFEVEATKSLAFLSSKLEKFSFSGNFTYVVSKIDMTDTEYNSRKLDEREGETVKRTRQMAGQAPYVVNVGFMYSDLEKGINAGLFYNVKGPTLLIVGTGFIPDVIQQPFHNLNFGISKKLGEEQKTEIDFKVDNILGDRRDEFFETYEGEDQVFTQFSPCMSISVGIKHKF